jgi:hypothetical protein
MPEVHHALIIKRKLDAALSIDPLPGSEPKEGVPTGPTPSSLVPLEEACTRGGTAASRCVAAKATQAGFALITKDKTVNTCGQDT